MIEIFVKHRVERIEFQKFKETKKRTNILDRTSKAKDFKRWLEASIKLLENDKNLDQALFAKSILEKYNHFSESEKVYLKQWKGKSSLEVIEHPEFFEVITYQRKTEFSEPKKIVKEVTKEEINKLIITINRINEGKAIPTRAIGEAHYKRDWNEMMGDRTHNGQQGLNVMLRLLDHYEWIVYVGGFTTIINPNDNIHEILKGLKK